MGQVGSSDTDDSVREIYEETATWNQLLRSSSDWSRYVKDRLERRDGILIHKSLKKQNNSLYPILGSLFGYICVRLLHRLQARKHLKLPRTLDSGPKMWK